MHRFPVEVNVEREIVVGVPVERFRYTLGQCTVVCVGTIERKWMIELLWWSEEVGNTC